MTAPARARRAPAMTERQLQAAVTALCRLYGIGCYHTFDSRRSPHGWPDLAICGSRGFITRELKTDAGRPTSAQVRWGERLRGAGVSWDIWRPADLHSGRVQRELEAIR